MRPNWQSNLGALSLCLALAAITCRNSFAEERAANEPSAQRPLHERIDDAIEQSHVGPVADIATDYEFVRRSYLDLIGRIPSAAEVREFIDTDNSSKRSDLIEKLLDSSEFNRHFAIVLDVMLMERFDGKKIDSKQWRRFLRNELEKKSPYNEIARKILAADGADAAPRAAAKFYLDRAVEPHALTRNVSRMFLGRDIQCAQCHDHPLVDDYLQSEYYGVFAFLNRSYLYEDAKDNKKPYVGEKAEGGVEFESVFDPDAGKSTTAPMLIDGLALDNEPVLDASEAYIVHGKDVRSVPKFSRREQLARLLTHDSSSAFATNIANRLWAHMMGRGLVHPVDLHHSDNPATHPELLKFLAQAFIASEFDIREFLRQIASTKTYQRSIDTPPIPQLELVEERRSSLLDQIVAVDNAKVKSLDELIEFNQQLQQARKHLATIDDKITTKQNEIAEQNKKADGDNKALSSKRKQLAEKKTAAASVASAAAEAKKATEAVKNDKALSNAAQTLQARADAIAKQVANLETQLEQHAKNIQSANDAANLLRRQKQRLISERMIAADLVSEARGARRAFQRRHEENVVRHRDLTQQLAAVETTARFQNAKDVLEGHQTKAANVASALEVSRQTRAATRQNLAGLMETLKQTQRKYDTQLAQLTASGAELDQKRELIDTIRESAATTREAADQLQDEALHNAAQTLSNRADQLASDAQAEADNISERQQEIDKTQSAIDNLDLTIMQDKSELTELETKVTQLEAELAAAQTAIAESEVAVTNATSDLKELWADRFVVRSLKPLSPEQMGRSLVFATGLDARFQREAEAEWEKSNKEQQDKAKEGKAIEKDPNGKSSDVDELARRSGISALLEKRIQDVEQVFVSLYAAPPGSPQDVFSATVDQALFAANDGRMRGWLNPSEGTLLKRLRDMTDDDSIAHEIYLSVLTRKPSEMEIKEITDYLASREKKERLPALQAILWGLLTSLEFRFNH